MTASEWKARLISVHQAASSGNLEPQTQLCQELAEMEEKLAAKKEPAQSEAPAMMTTDPPQVAVRGVPPKKKKEGSNATARPAGQVERHD